MLHTLNTVDINTLQLVPGDTEHSKPDSISWQAMRLAVTRLCINQMEEFLRVAGVEPQGTIVINNMLRCAF